MQNIDGGLAEDDPVTAVVQFGARQFGAPEIGLGLEEMKLRVGRAQQFLDAVDVVVMAVGEQDVADAYVLRRRQLQNLGHIPRRIDHCGAAAGLIVDDVDEIFHRAEFERMDVVAGLGHGVLHGLLDGRSGGSRDFLWGSVSR